MVRALRRHEDVNLPSIASLDDTWDAERRWFGARNVLSALAVPLSDQGELIGFLGFEAVSREWTFETGHTNTLRSAAGSSARPSPASGSSRSSPASRATTR